MRKLCECGCGRPVGLAKYTNRRIGLVKGQPVRMLTGHGARRHGMHGTPEYQAYIGARYRCSNPNWPEWQHYGGRGIKFLFDSFEQFFAELGPRPTGKSLDRFPNNDGHYAPGNVRWATRSEQRVNQRKVRALQSFTNKEILAECKRRNLWVTRKR